ncbi:MAG: electron transport complex subunit RsxC [bacterium]
MAMKKTFKGGVHPAEQKYRTEKKKIQKIDAPETVIIPLQQHIGAPSEPLVKKKDTVKMGQVIGKSSKFVSAVCHASVSGTVKAVEERPHPLGTKVLSVVIENDGKDTWYEKPEKHTDYMKLSKAMMTQRIKEAGLAGMGGAAFPSHVKLSPPEDKPIDYVILNGAECEPFLTADHRLMLENTDDILAGLNIIRKILNVSKAVIGIEKNKPDAIKKMRKKTVNMDFVSVLPLNVKYPQGAEKQLIKAATGREVPCGGLPMDVGCLVHNVGTSQAIFQAVSSKKPFIERVVTVTGPGVKKPGNFKVKIGTPFQYLIDFCGGYTKKAAKIINGGPIMGIAQITDEVPVIKGTSGILVLDEKTAKLHKEKPCIACARCVDICPMQLVPSHIASFIEYKDVDKAQKIGLLDCMECGSCSYICPSKRHLVHYIKLGKLIWNKNQQQAN